MKKIYLFLLVTVMSFVGTQKLAYAGGNCPVIDAWDVLNPTFSIYPFGIVTGSYSGTATLSGDLFYEGSFLMPYESIDGSISLFDLNPGSYEFFYCGISLPFTVTGIPCDISILNIAATNVSGAGCNPNGVVDLTVGSSTPGQTFYYNLTELTTSVEYTGQDDGFGIISIPGLPAGVYTIFVSTEQDVLISTCNANDLVTILEPSCDMAINTPSATNVTSQGAMNGSISAAITGSSCIPSGPGGTPIFVVYALLNGTNVGNLIYNSINLRYELSGLGVGTYTLVAENGGTTCFASTNLTVSLPTPSTQLANGVCGNLGYVRTSSISCILVPGATYQWQFSNGNGVYATKSSTTNYIALHTVTPILNWGTTWTLQVRAIIGSNAGAYSAPCTIGIIQDPAIAGVPNTQLRTADCNKQNYRINADNRIITNPIFGANQYEFQFSTVGASPVVFATILRPNTVLFLNTVSPALVFPAQYTVRTRARIASTWGSFGTPCLIGIIGLNREDNGATEELQFDADGNTISVETPFFDLVAMPNPYSDVTSIIINSSVNENVYVQFYDLTGKIVEDIKVTTNERFNVGANLSKGIYLLRARSDSGNQITTRLVKTN